MNASSTLNISTSRTADVFEAIGKAVKTEFHASFYGTINNQTFQVEPGRAGFLGFTLTYRCYDGVTGDCVDDDVPSGTPLTACKPATLDGDDSQPYPALDGTTNFVTTSPESVKDMPTNPAAEIPKNAPKVDSGAATFGQGGGISMAIFMSMGIVAWLAL